MFSGRKGMMKYKKGTLGLISMNQTQEATQHDCAERHPE